MNTKIILGTLEMMMCQRPSQIVDILFLNEPVIFSFSNELHNNNTYSMCDDNVALVVLDSQQVQTLDKFDSMESSKTCIDMNQIIFEPIRRNKTINK